MYILFNINIQSNWDIHICTSTIINSGIQKILTKAAPSILHTACWNTLKQPSVFKAVSFVML